jgi:hypothetical protein
MMLEECERCARLRGTPDELDRDWPAGDCRWCGEPSAWVWQFEGEPHTDSDWWRLQSDWELCDTCQSLTLAGRDTELVERAVDSVMCEGMFEPSMTPRRERMRAALAIRVAHWINRRTTYEAL